jgi:hypothetical protein
MERTQGKHVGTRCGLSRVSLRVAGVSFFETPATYLFQHPWASINGAFLPANSLLLVTRRPREESLGARPRSWARSPTTVGSPVSERASIGE